jgi:hypothetical protein
MEDTFYNLVFPTEIYILSKISLQITERKLYYGVFNFVNDILYS